MPEGVCIHGLFIEGGIWDGKAKRLEESNSKDLQPAFPVIYYSA